MVAIGTEAFLQEILNKIATSVMEDVSEAILEVFLENYVIKYAYASGQTRYTNPTGKFVEAWKWTDIKKTAKTFSMTMFNDWETMTAGAQGGHFIHSSYANPDKWGYDTREDLAAYLDSDLQGTLDTSGRLGKYWTKFYSELIESGKLTTIINRYAKKHGLSLGVS